MCQSGSRSSPPCCAATTQGASPSLLPPLERWPHWASLSANITESPTWLNIYSISYVIWKRHFQHAKVASVNEGVQCAATAQSSMSLLTLHLHFPEKLSTNTSWFSPPSHICTLHTVLISTSIHLTFFKKVPMCTQNREACIFMTVPPSRRGKLYETDSDWNYKFDPNLIKICFWVLRKLIFAELFHANLPIGGIRFSQF